MSTLVVDQEEAYTSKTCSNCGWIDQSLSSKKVFSCKSCKIKIDRDYNGARGIFLRALDEKKELEDFFKHWEIAPRLENSSLRAFVNIC